MCPSPRVSPSHFSLIIFFLCLSLCLLFSLPFSSLLHLVRARQEFIGFVPLWVQVPGDMTCVSLAWTGGICCLCFTVLPSQSAWGHLKFDRKGRHTPTGVSCTKVSFLLCIFFFNRPNTGGQWVKALWLAIEVTSCTICDFTHLVISWLVFLLAYILWFPSQLDLDVGLLRTSPETPHRCGSYICSLSVKTAPIL